MGRTKGAKDKKPRKITEEHREKMRNDMIKKREAIDHKNPVTIAKRQAGLVKARAAIDNNAPNVIAARQRNLEKARDAINHQDPELIAARQANMKKAHLNNPSHIKHKYNELFNECIQIPETPRDEDGDE
jgi:hypothetical protein